MIGVLERYEVSFDEQAIKQFLLTGRQIRYIGMRLNFVQRASITALFNPDEPFHCEIDDCGRHHLIVVVHLPNVAQ